MKLNREEVLRIGVLARLSLTASEVEQMQNQLSNILANFEILNKLDTRAVTPTTHSILLENVVRQDIVTSSAPREQVLANAPQVEDDCFKVRAVLED
jgi:aspartyl-tRNA(Asn)/glutamyl-tRNA(Gln) amidotransferase subunit C